MHGKTTCFSCHSCSFLFRSSSSLSSSPSASASASPAGSLSSKSGSGELKNATSRRKLEKQPFSLCQSTSTPRRRRTVAIAFSVLPYTTAGERTLTQRQLVEIGRPAGQHHRNGFDCACISVDTQRKVFVEHLSTLSERFVDELWRCRLL